MNILYVFNIFGWWKWEFSSDTVFCIQSQNHLLIKKICRCKYVISLGKICKMKPLLKTAKLEAKVYI